MTPIDGLLIVVSSKGAATLVFDNLVSTRLDLTPIPLPAGALLYGMLLLGAGRVWRLRKASRPA